MSTKTTTKRLALATVVAVGAGLLSIVSVSSANAAGTAAGTGTNIGLGENAADGLTAVLSATTASTAKSVGLVTSSVSASYPLASTATMLTSGKLAVAVTPTAGTRAGLYVTGGTIDTATSATSFVVSNKNYIVAGAVTDSIAAIIVPNAGATTVTIQGYSGVTSTSTTPDGTLKGALTVSLVSSTTSGTVSVSKSAIYYANTTDAQAYGYVATGATSATLVDNPTAGTGTTDFNSKQLALILARDAYGNALTTGSLITASATNGAYVDLADAVNAPSGISGTSVMEATGSTITSTYSNTSSTDYVVSTSSKYYSFNVWTTGNAPVSTTVTISVGGTVIGTKAFTFGGKVAKVVLKSATNGKVSGTGSATVQYLDAAGNDVTPVHGVSSTVYTTSVTQDAGTAGLGITTAGTLTQPTGGTYDNKLSYNCPASNVTGQIAVAYTNPLDGTVVSSNGIAVTCSGAADTYTAAFDKKSYVAGDIATLTVTFKDSKGAIAADIAAGSTGAITDGADTSTATNVPSVTGSQLTIVGAPTKSDVTTNGVLTYKFVVGTTAGAYQAVVIIPQVNANANGTSQSAAYAVTDGGGTSLNDVLKGIVSLIASINKQIAALAKLVTKKK